MKTDKFFAIFLSLFVCLDSIVVTIAKFIGKSQIWCRISRQIEAVSRLYQGNLLGDKILSFVFSDDSTN